MSAYITHLKRQTTIAQVEPLQAESLRDRYDAWFAALPEAAKHRHWSMEELSATLEIEPRQMSSVLLEAGWLRKRVWLERSKGNGRYLRVWLPPRATVD